MIRRDEHERRRQAFARDRVSPPAPVVPDELEASALDWNTRAPMWWQQGLRAPSYGDGSELAAVHACQSVIAQSVAPVRLRHMRLDGDVWVEVKGSRFASVLRNPNPYQTGLELRLWQMYSVIGQGNAYTLIVRDAVGRPTQLYPLDPRRVLPQRADDGSIFYSVPFAEWETIDRPQVIPARDVWHLRGRTAQDPLIGLSPLHATYYVRILQTEIQKTSAEFFANKARPGGILTTDNTLKPATQKMVLEAWERGAQDGFRGRTALLDSGITYSDLTVSAADAAIVAQYELSIAEIARAHNVPGWKIGLGDPSYANAETMDRAFHAESLRFWFDTYEASAARAFRLGPRETFDHAVDERLAKLDTDKQYEGLRRAIQGGMMTPNEARQRLGLPPLPEGDELLVQQQMVPLSRALEPPQEVPPELDQDADEDDDDQDDDNVEPIRPTGTDDE